MATDPQKLFQSALECHRSGDLAGASRLYYAFLDHAPEHAETLYLLGVMAVQTGDAPRGEGLIARAIAQYGDVALYHNAMGHALQQQGRLAEALQSFERAVKLQPAFAEAQQNLGAVALALGMKDRAAAAWGCALEGAPQNPKLASDLASLLKMLGRFEQAQVLYNWAITLSPQDPVLAYNRFLLECAMQDARYWGRIAAPLLTASVLPPPYVYEMAVRSAIAAWLEADDATLRKALARAEEWAALIGQGAERNTRNMLAYHRYLAALSESGLVETKPAARVCEAFGDSNVLGLARQSVGEVVLQPHLVMGGKAWHFAQDGENEYKRQLIDQVARAREGAARVFVFGEIDCRSDEGLLQYVQKEGADLVTCVDATVRGYVDFIAQLCVGQGAFGFVNVPVPNVPALMAQKTDFTTHEAETVRRVVQLFNAALTQKAQRVGAFVVDAYDVSRKGPEGAGHIDAFHLRPAVVRAAFEGVFDEKT